MMDKKAEEILEEALSLSMGTRASIADELLASLDKPDPEIDNLWKKEVESRILSAQRGKMEIISEEDVLKKYKKG